MAGDEDVGWSALHLWLDGEADAGGVGASQCEWTAGDDDDHRLASRPGGRSSHRGAVALRPHVNPAPVGSEAQTASRLRASPPTVRAMNVADADVPDSDLDPRGAALCFPRCQASPNCHRARGSDSTTEAGRLDQKSGWSASSPAANLSTTAPGREARPGLGRLQGCARRR